MGSCRARVVVLGGGGRGVEAGRDRTRAGVLLVEEAGAALIELRETTQVVVGFKFQKAHSGSSTNASPGSLNLDGGC